MKDAGIYATFTIIETLLTVIVPYFPIKENIKILGLLYALGVVSGIIIELVIRLI